MALETLKGVTEIGGYSVAELTEFADKRPEEFIVVNHKNNGISFKIQNGPVKENGVNGCQVDTLIHAAVAIIDKLNDKYPCAENRQTLVRLREAIAYQNLRTKDREKRNVEGTSNV